MTNKAYEKIELRLSLYPIETTILRYLFDFGDMTTAVSIFHATRLMNIETLNSNEQPIQHAGTKRKST
ncbi:4558_t:CDS:2 [Funneliformis geosporum]|uniref:1998_t:CDS:1 n=1 Tax=Funneliformis geosporum TaxID=1117311 RepID=A0A9W4SPT8_9GLOM|nr:4558_t:CDS:2 [Funneliformis geosporum]CAI2177211.1 1998_t:CDS:2 [Funneliformis geosporum]